MIIEESFYYSQGQRIPFYYGKTEQLDQRVEHVIVNLHSCHREPLDWNKLKQRAYVDIGNLLMSELADNCLVVHPTGLGNSLFYGVGTSDIYQCLCAISKIFELANPRIYLVGFSMGAASVLHLVKSLNGCLNGAYAFGGYSLSLSSWKKVFVDDSFLNQKKIDEIDILGRSNGKLDVGNVIIGHGKLDLGVGGGVPYSQFIKIRKRLEDVIQTKCNLKTIVLNEQHISPDVKVLRDSLDFLMSTSTQPRFKKCLNALRQAEKLSWFNFYYSDGEYYQNQIVKGDLRLFLQSNGGVSCGPFRDGHLLLGGSLKEIDSNTSQSFFGTNVLYGNKTDNSQIKQLLYLNSCFKKKYDSLERHFNSHCFRLEIELCGNHFILFLGEDYPLLASFHGCSFYLSPPFLAIDKKHKVLTEESYFL